MLKFYRFLLLPLTAVFLASTAGIACYAADSCTQARMYRQLAALTENFPDDTVSTGNDFLPQYQALYTQNSDLAGWILIDGTSINYPVMQSKQDPDLYLKHNFEKADSPHGCPYVQANCDLQTPSDNILVYGHNMKDGTMFSDLLQYKRESFWQQHRIIRFDTLTAQAEYTVMAVFRGEAEDLFAYYQFADAETPQEFAAYVDACKNAALYETGVTAAYGDKLLTLSTCDDSGKGWTEHVFPDQSFASLCHVQDKLKELDLVPFAMSGHTNLMDADRLPDFIMNMRLAHFFGCKYIVSSIGEAHLKDKAKTGNEVLVQNIKGLIPHLKENGLMLVLELHGEHATGTIMNEIVTAVNSNLVKINYDTANCVFYGNVDAADDIDTCMDNVAYLHIKDKAGARDAWDFPALGKGYVDFKTLFNKLDKANNDAPLSLEIEFTAKGPKDLDEINTAVKESAAYLENLGYKI